MSITIKDLAKLANVSHTTVSRALNNSPHIHKDTKEQIQALAKKYNYVPNINAKSLVMDRTYNIGLFFSTLNLGTSSVFFHEVVRGVNRIIKEKYSLVVKGIDDYQNFSSITSKSFDGIIVMSQSTGDNPFIEHVISKNIPTVVLNRKVDYVEVGNILSDDFTGAYNVVNYLIEQGHELIAIIEGKIGFHSTQERNHGYATALKNRGINVSHHYQVQGNYDIESGFEAMKKLLEQKPYPTAVFCSNDDMAVGAMKAISEKKLKVPQDISLVGFDDSMLSAYITPALTTVKRPIELISQEGAKHMLARLDHQDVARETIYMKTELVVRQSVHYYE